MGRVVNILLPYDRRHPIILPPPLKFLESFIDQRHQDFYRVNRNFIRAPLATRFWVPGEANSAIKRALRRCVICTRRRRRAQPTNQLMG